MKSERTKFLLCLLFFIVLAAITFRCTWPVDHVFAASDMNIGRMALKKYTLPEQMTGFFRSTPILGATNYRYMLFNVLVMMMPLGVAAKIIWGLILVAGSMSMTWFLRLWHRSWPATICGALMAFWFNSVTLASAGHGYKMEVLVLSVLSLCFIEKAVRTGTGKSSVGFSLLAGATIGVMLLEQQDVALLAGFFIGAYAVFRLIQARGRPIYRWALLLVPVGMVALLVSGSMIFKSYKQNVSNAAAMQGKSQDKWNFVTQWSMVPSEWPDLIAPGWSGWSTGNPEGPYWGKIGRSAEWEQTKQGFQNFRLDSSYIGIVPFLLAGVGLMSGWKIRKSEEGAQVVFWSGVGLLGLLLAFGKYCFLYKLFYRLPLVNNIRAPIKLLDNFQICLAVVAAFGLDAMLQSKTLTRKAHRRIGVGVIVAGGLTLAAGLRLALFPQGKLREFEAMGMGSFADLMTRNMAGAWVHAGVLAFILTILVFILLKKKQYAHWAGMALVIVLAVDSLMLTSHYFKAQDITALKKGNVVTSYLKENQGNNRIYFLDQSGIYNQWLASDVPYNRLNVFNIWQMPRMPEMDKHFLSIVGRNQIRLWQLSSVKYVAAPAGILQQLKQDPQMAAQFETVLSYQVPTAQGMRPDVLLEFKGAIPRFSLYQGWEVLPAAEHCSSLASPEHAVRSTLLVTPESGLIAHESDRMFHPVEGRMTKKHAVLDVNVDQPSVLRFSQRYQPEWSVYVDGQRQRLLQVDYLCMGVLVPPGTHSIEFRCLNAMPQAMVVLGILLLSVSVALYLVLSSRKSQ